MTGPSGTTSPGQGAGGASHRRRLTTFWRGLRGHATAAFVAIALLLSATMALTVWLTVSQFLMVQRERSTIAQAVANADQVQRGMQTRGISQAELLSGLSREIGSVSLLVDDGQWFTTSLQTGRDDLPAALRTAVVAGQPVSQRLDLGDRTVMVVGVPLAGLDQGYFEVFPLQDLDRTLRTLSTVLVAAVIAITLLALPLGWWATRPVFRPLTRVADAAAAIAAGDLGARIDAADDPDLEPIAASFNETAAALELRVRSDARFAADVAHELRSPLTTMLNAVALVDAHRRRLPGEAVEALDLLASEVERFARLVQDLLEISRTDAGNADLALEPVELSTVVRHSLPERHRPKLEVDASAQDLVVVTDKRRLERVLANLVENADAHGGGLRSVRVARDGERVRILVEDAGPGVSVEDRERIFQRFARGRRSDRDAAPGVGLGLALVARHVHLLDGDVRLQESAWGGASFVVTLPSGRPA